LKLAEERYNQGIISYYDYLNIKIQKEEALLNYKKVEKDYYNSLFDLKLILGIRNDTLFVPEDININEIKLRKIKEKKLLKYEAEKYSERISKLNFLRDLVSFLPEVYFSYYYSYRDSLFKNLFDEPGRTRGYYLSLSLRFWDYPFNLWKDKTNLDIERQRVKKALIMSEVGIKKAEKEIEVQKSSLKVAKQKLSISELGYQIALESFKLGKISSIELREAEENLTRAEIDYITSLYDYKLSLSYYLYLTGNLEVKKEEE
jgi:outer membrane protein TolC